jgi:hypothetical protein
VLIVLAIAAIVVLRFTYSSRLRAQQAKCHNNLRALGLACHSYEDVWGRLPWNWDSAFGGHPDLGYLQAPPYPDRPFSWIVAVLPFFEEQAIYDKIDFDTIEGNASDNGKPLRDQPMGQVNNNLYNRQLALKGLLCPANMQPSVPKGQNRGYADAGGTGPPAARTDYTGNMGHVWGGWRDCATIPDFPHLTGVFVRNQKGTPWVNGDYDTDQPYCQGLFYYRGSAKLDDCIDGTANTLMLMEDYHWRGGNDEPVGGPHELAPSHEHKKQGVAGRGGRRSLSRLEQQSPRRRSRLPGRRQRAVLQSGHGPLRALRAGHLDWRREARRQEAARFQVIRELIMAPGYSYDHNAIRLSLVG